MVIVKSFFTNVHFAIKQFKHSIFHNNFHILCEQGLNFKFTNMSIAQMYFFFIPEIKIDKIAIKEKTYSFLST